MPRSALSGCRVGRCWRSELRSSSRTTALARALVGGLLALWCNAAAFLSVAGTPRGHPRGFRSAVSLEAKVEGQEMVAGDVVTVIGASGNVGKVTTLRLLDESFKVRAVVRSPESKQNLEEFLGPDRSGRVDFFEADTAKSPEGLDAALSGAAAAIICTGTTAFPTGTWAGGGVGPDDVWGAVWDAWSSNGFDRRKGLDALTAAGLNTPDAVDGYGIEAVVSAIGRAGKSFKRLVFMSSIGVTKRTGFPYFILNGAGVLDAKARGETAVREAAQRDGFTWTIVRPGTLFGKPNNEKYFFDGARMFLEPFEVYSKENTIRALDVQRGDEQVGETLRSSVAEVLVQSLLSSSTHNVDFTATNVKGEAPDAEAIQKQLSAALL